MIIGIIFAAIVLGITVADTVDQDFIRETVMTVEERNRYNTAPWYDECIFDEQGHPTNDRGGFRGCWDGRMINRRSETARPGFHLMTGQGTYLKPYYPEPEAITTPSDMTIVWYDNVSQVEVICFQLMEEAGQWPDYSVACYDARLKMAHVVNGDYRALEHEIRHHDNPEFTHE